MKQLFFGIALLFIAVSTQAQSAFEKVMTEKINKLETSSKADDLQTLMNDFERISKKTEEKDLWLPNYYAALSAVRKGRAFMMKNETQNLDEIGDIALRFANKADEQSPNNAEVQLLLKMIYSLKMMVNPQERYMTLGMKAVGYLNAAEKLDADNPRITLLKAEDMYYTPEQFGGSKTKGLELFQKALDQFKTYKTKSALHPNWGAHEAEYFIKNKP